MLALMSSRTLLKLLSLLLAVLVLAFSGYALIEPSNSYLLMPDRAHALNPIVKVQGAKPETDTGGIFFLDVLERRATWAERYLPFLRSDGTLVPARDITPANITDQERQRLDLAAMHQSKTIAAAVALRSLGYKIEVRPIGALVAETAPGSPAARSLSPGNIIVAVDGQPVRAVSELGKLITRHRVGDRITLTVRDGNLRRVTLRTYAERTHPERPLIGVFVQQAANVRLPRRVKISSGDVVGPSAGLAFALEVYDKLGTDIDRGYKIAATGALGLDGSVQEIGGVREKAIGARRSGIDIMLVPAGENASEARRYAGGMKIVAVRSFQQALRSLATLTARKKK
jgi:PDZ domain-containing protein